MQHKDDYDLSELEKITVRKLAYNIMPRYRYHYVDNDYERFSLDLLNVLVEEGTTVIDIGAHYGIYSLLSAQRAGQVFAFEPVAENFSILQKNIADNAFKNITVINKAVSDSDGEVTFNVPWASDSAGFYEHPNAESIRKVKVQTAAIDSALPNVDDLSFVKIDTEGHEIHVLEGMQQILKRNKKAKLLVEFNPECLQNAGYRPEDLIAKLRELNYDIFAVYEDDRRLMLVDEQTTVPHILGERTYLNFLCLQKATWTSMLLSSHSASISGGELRLFEIVDGLRTMQDTFVLPYVILPAHGPLEEKLRDLPVALEVIPMQGWVQHDILTHEEKQQIHAVNVEAIVALSRVFSDFKPQLAFTNSITIPWTAQVAEVFGVPHIWSLNEFGDLDHGFTFDYGYAESLKKIAQQSQAVLVNSKAVYEHVHAEIPEDKLQLIYQKIPPIAATSKKAPAIFTKQATLRFVMCGLITPSKGQFEAVQALQLLREQGVQAELMLIGDTGSEAYRRDIEVFCKEHDLTKYVHFTGFLADRFDYMAQADVFLMCSAQEAYGRVTLEGMLLGKPVVAANSGGTPELLHDTVSALLYPPHDIAALAEHMQTFATEPERISTMGKAAQKDAQAYCGEDFAELHAVFNKIKQSVVPRKPIFRDLLDGAVLLASNSERDKRLVSQAHQKEIADFSEAYNKVYEAYHVLEAQIADLTHRLSKEQSHVVNRLVRKTGHVLKHYGRGHRKSDET